MIYPYINNKNFTAVYMIIRLSGIYSYTLSHIGHRNSAAVLIFFFNNQSKSITKMYRLLSTTISYDVDAWSRGTN